MCWRTEEFGPTIGLLRYRHFVGSPCRCRPGMLTTRSCHWVGCLAAGLNGKPDNCPVTIYQKYYWMWRFTCVGTYMCRRTEEVEPSVGLLCHRYLIGSPCRGRLGTLTTSNCNGVRCLAAGLNGENQTIVPLLYTWNISKCDVKPESTN